MSGPTNGLILGIDPGLAGTGFALLSGSDLVLSCSTLLTTPGRDGARLLAITRHLRDLIAGQPPSEASLEELFMGRNASSAIGVAQARGAILAVLEECGVPVFEYKPSQVKMVLTGKINPELVTMINGLGGQAVGMSGEDGPSILVRPIGNVVYFMPPYIVDEADMDLMVQVAADGIELATCD